MSIRNLLANINREDLKVPVAVAAVIPRLERLVALIVRKIKAGGRLFYLGAGTSGRLGVVDASEIPPTYGAHGLVIAIIAGGDGAIRKAVEFAEDDAKQGWEDLRRHGCAKATSYSASLPPAIRRMSWVRLRRARRKGSLLPA